MRISIAMATFNGENFVNLQLKSIIMQTLKPDEIVIVDDCSSDSTIDIINNFKKEYSTIDWVIIKNKENLGWKKNFQKAILATTGDLIFLCDQDDFWYKHKIGIMANCLIQNDTVELVSGLYKKSILDEKYVESDLKSYDIDSVKNLRKMNFDNNFYMINYPGCNLAFKKDLKDYFSLKYFSGKRPHDEHVWIISKLRETAFLLEEETMIWNRHEKSATKKKKSNKNVKLEFIEDKINCIDDTNEIMKNISISKDLNQKIEIIEKVQSFLILRKKFLISPSMVNLLCLSKCISMYQRKMVFILDVFLGFLGKEE